MLSSTRANAGYCVALAIMSVVALPRAAQAQCPVGSMCYFGSDLGGNRFTRATDALASAARNDFVAAVNGATTVTFEGASVQSTSAAMDFGAHGTAAFSGGRVRQVSAPKTDGNGRYATSGDSYFQFTSSAGGSSARTTTAGTMLSFSAPVTAFGFTGIDIGDFGSQLSLRFTLADGGLLDWALPYTATRGRNSARDGSILFAGLTNTTGFTSVQFMGTNSADTFAFDDLVIGSAALTAPEPATYLMLGTGIVALFAVGGRRRSRD
jgi:hypothetical protein